MEVIHGQQEIVRAQDQRDITISPTSAVKS
jgi:hypothetical protein